MPTQIIRVPGVSTNPNLPKFYIDSRLTKGSLLLVDFSHDATGITSIPANNTTVKNLAFKSAVTLTGANEASISPTIVNTITATGGLMELTSKKGLHGIISQVNDIQSGNEFQIVIPSAIRTYIYNNINRGFFISVWDRKTRLATTATTSCFYLFLQNTSNLGTSFQNGGSGLIGKNLGSRATSTSLNSLSPQFNNTGISQLTGSPATTDPSKFKFGSADSYSFYDLNKSCSQVLYQLHIVDLTSAGLTYAQADALDQAAFNAAFDVGGRFYNDTFTSPSTLP